MGVPPSVLDGPYLKAYRAKTHINELTRISQPLHPSLYELTVDFAPYQINSNPAHWHLVYTPRPLIDKLMGAIIGDAIHNIRAALDHLASGILRTRDAKAKPYFPIPDTWEEFLPEEGQGSKPRVIELMEVALPGSKELITKEIRPIDNSRDSLWKTIKTLDVDDKHNLLVPTVVVSGISNIAGFTGNNSFRRLSVNADATKPCVLLRTDQPMNLHYEPDVAVNICFGERTPMHGEPVIPALTDAANLITETVKAFDALIRKNS